MPWLRQGGDKDGYFITVGFHCLALLSGDDPVTELARILPDGGYHAIFVFVTHYMGAKWVRRG